MKINVKLKFRFIYFKLILVGFLLFAGIGVFGGPTSVRAADYYAEGAAVRKLKSPAFGQDFLEWSQGESNPSSRTSTRRGRTSGGPLNSTNNIITNIKIKQKPETFKKKSRTFGALIASCELTL